MYPQSAITERTTRPDVVGRTIRVRVSCLLAGVVLAASLPLTASANTMPGGGGAVDTTASLTSSDLHPAPDQALPLPRPRPGTQQFSNVVGGMLTPKLNATLDVYPPIVSVRSFPEATQATVAYKLSITNSGDQRADDVEVTVPGTLFPNRLQTTIPPAPDPIFAQSFTFVGGTNHFRCWVVPTTLVSGFLGHSVDAGYARCNSGSIAAGSTATIRLTVVIDGQQLTYPDDLGVHHQEVLLAWQNYLAHATASADVTILDCPHGRRCSS